MQDLAEIRDGARVLLDLSAPGAPRTPQPASQQPLPPGVLPPPPPPPGASGNANHPSGQMPAGDDKKKDCIIS